MPVRRRPLLLLAASFALAGLGGAACSENPLTAPGIDNEILIKNAGPLGVAPPGQFGPWAWAVNTIDSLLFEDEIDSTRLEVTSFRMTDPLDHTVAGTVRFMPDSVFIYYTQPFPSAAYGFKAKNPRFRPKLRKMYFVPDEPLHGHTEYTCRLSTGIRMTKGTLVRDAFEFRFTTGDSVAPPSPAR